MRDLAALQQVPQAEAVRAGIVRDDRQVLDARGLDLRDQAFGIADQAEAARHDRHPVAKQAVERRARRIVELVHSDPEHGAALLAHELRHVPAAEPALARRARALPAAEGLEAGPGAGRRAAGAVGIEDAGLDGVEEAVELGLVLRVDAGGQAERAAVGVRDRLVEIVERQDAEERHEQFVAIDPVVGRQSARRWSAAT